MLAQDAVLGRAWKCVRSPGGAAENCDLIEHRELLIESKSTDRHSIPSPASSQCREKGIKKSPRVHPELHKRKTLGERQQGSSPGSAPDAVDILAPLRVSLCSNQHTPAKILVK